MSSLTSPELDSETILSTESTVPTTPEGSLNGGTDKSDANSPGTKATGDKSDLDSSIFARPVRSICCVGAGYVGKCTLSLYPLGPTYYLQSNTDPQQVDQPLPCLH